MRTPASLFAASAVAIVLALAGCSSPSNTSAAAPAASATATSAPTAMASMHLSGTFAGLNGKTVTGSASIDGETITLSGFSTDEGPDLHFYLANGTDEAAVAAGVEIGAVDAATGTVTIQLPAGVSASTYTDLIVHCDKAKAVFGAATLA